MDSRICTWNPSTKRTSRLIKGTQKFTKFFKFKIGLFKQANDCLLGRVLGIDKVIAEKTPYDFTKKK